MRTVHQKGLQTINTAPRPDEREGSNFFRPVAAANNNAPKEGRRSAASNDEFAVHTDFNGQRMVLSLKGELDLASAPILERVIRTVVYENLEELVFDLHELVFIDSTGLKLMIRAAQAAAFAGRQVSVQRVPEQPRRLFEIAGVIEALNVQS